MLHTAAFLAGLAAIELLLLRWFGPWGWFVPLVLVLLVLGERRRKRA